MFRDKHPRWSTKGENRPRPASVQLRLSSISRHSRMSGDGSCLCNLKNIVTVIPKPLLSVWSWLSQHGRQPIQQHLSPERYDEIRPYLRLHNHSPRRSLPAWCSRKHRVFRHSLVQQEPEVAHHLLPVTPVVCWSAGDVRHPGGRNGQQCNGGVEGR